MVLSKARTWSVNPFSKHHLIWMHVHRRLEQKSDMSSMWTVSVMPTFLNSDSSTLQAKMKESRKMRTTWLEWLTNSRKSNSSTCLCLLSTEATCGLMRVQEKSSKFLKTISEQCSGKTQPSCSPNGQATQLLSKCERCNSWRRHKENNKFLQN